MNLFEHLCLDPDILQSIGQNSIICDEKRAILSTPVLILSLQEIVHSTIYHRFSLGDLIAVFILCALVWIVDTLLGRVSNNEEVTFRLPLHLARKSLLYNKED